MACKLTKVLSFLLCFLLIFEQSGFAQVAGQLDISAHILSLRNSLIQDKFRPLHLRSLSYDNLNNNFQLLLDKGDSKDLKSNTIEQTARELLNYFFVGITLPNDSFWVNLRPDSPDNIIDPALGTTDVGKILLEADLQLKKDTAKFTSPQTPEGKKYWDKLYKKAEEILGYENSTIPTLTRPWIVPGEIIIRETESNAYIYKATLKVMLEEDYLKDSATYNFKDERLKQLNEYSSQLLRELIIPKLTKEVNTAQRYAPLRQVYYSLILAQWFKQKFYGRGGLYSWLIDKKNLNGLTSKTDWSKTTYFKEYQKSFKEGEYNLKEPIYTPTGQIVRSYFSGGIAFGGTGGQGILEAIRKGLILGKRNILELPKNLKYITRLSIKGGTVSDPSSIEVVNVETKDDESSSVPSIGRRDIHIRTREVNSHTETNKIREFIEGFSKRQKAKLNNSFLEAVRIGKDEKQIRKILSGILKKRPSYVETALGVYRRYPQGFVACVEAGADLNEIARKELPPPGAEWKAASQLEELAEVFQSSRDKGNLLVQIRDNEREYRYTLLEIRLEKEYGDVGIQLAQFAKRNGINEPDIRDLEVFLGKDYKLDTSELLKFLQNAQNRGQDARALIQDLTKLIGNKVTSYGLANFIAQVISKKDRGSIQIIQELRESLYVNPQYADIVNELLQREAKYETKRDALGYIAESLSIANSYDKGGAKDNTQETINAFKETIGHYSRGEIGDKKFLNQLKNISFKFKTSLFNELLSKPISQEEMEQIGQQLGANKLFSLTGIYFRIREQDVKDKIRIVLDKLVEFQGDIKKLNRWLYEESEWNKEEIAELIKMGYDASLWRDGIVIEEEVSSQEAGEALKQISKQTEQLIEIAEKLGIPVSEETKRNGLNSYQEAKQFVDEVIVPATDKEKITTDLSRILNETERLEKIYQDTKIRKEMVRVEIKKDFLEDSYSGVGVPGCFNPITGIHKEAPLVHALESNGFFLRVYQQEKMIANAVIVLTDKGAVVFGLYNSTNLNLDEAVFEAIKELSRKVPRVLMTSQSVSFDKAKLYGQEETVLATKHEKVIEKAYHDFGESANGNTIFDMSLSLTQDMIQQKDGFREKPKRTVAVVDEGPKQIDFNWDGLAKSMISRGLKDYLFLIGELKKDKVDMNTVTREIISGKIAQKGRQISNNDLDRMYGIIHPSLNAATTVDLGAQVSHIKKLDNLLRILNILRKSENVPEISENASDREIIEFCINELKAQGLIEEIIDEYGNKIIEIKKEAENNRLAQAIREWAIDKDGGVQAINFQGTEGIWTIVGFASELDDKNTLEHEQKEIAYRKQGYSWIEAHNMAGGQIIDEESAKQYKAGRQDEVGAAVDRITREMIQDWKRSVEKGREALRKGDLDTALRIYKEMRQLRSKLDSDTENTVRKLAGKIREVMEERYKEDKLDVDSLLKRVDIEEIAGEIIQNGVLRGAESAAELTTELSEIIKVKLGQYAQTKVGKVSGGYDFRLAFLLMHWHPCEHSGFIKLSDTDIDYNPENRWVMAIWGTEFDGTGFYATVYDKKTKETRYYALLPEDYNLPITRIQGYRFSRIDEKEAGEKEQKIKTNQQNISKDQTKTIFWASYNETAAEYKGKDNLINEVEKAIQDLVEDRVIEIKNKNSDKFQVKGFFELLYRKIPKDYQYDFYAYREIFRQKTILAGRLAALFKTRKTAQEGGEQSKNKQIDSWEVFFNEAMPWHLSDIFGEPKRNSHEPDLPLADPSSVFPTGTGDAIPVTGQAEGGMVTPDILKEWIKEGDVLKLVAHITRGLQGQDDNTKNEQIQFIINNLEESKRNEFMKALKEKGIEKDLFWGIQNRVLDEKELEEFMKKNGFLPDTGMYNSGSKIRSAIKPPLATTGHRGTYKSEQYGVYLYIKRQFQSESLEQSERDLLVARYLTSLGILYPNTQWGVFRMGDGRYSLFACTRELEAFGITETLESKQKILTRAVLEKELKHKIDEPEYFSILINREDSHIYDWLARLKTKGYRFDSQRRDYTDDIFMLLNVVEASHPDNWAWDPATGMLYPIDIEVLDFGGDERKSIINNIIKRVGLDKDTESDSFISSYKKTNSSSEIDKKGGIDFRAMPIVTQPMQPSLGTVPLGAEVNPLASTVPVVNLDNEWQQIQNMVQRGIVPSAQRIKEYLVNCSEKEEVNKEADKVLACIADILRLEEDQASRTDPAIKEFLGLLESNKPNSELQLALTKITILPGAPKPVNP